MCQICASSAAVIIHFTGTYARIHSYIFYLHLPTQIISVYEKNTKLLTRFFHITREHANFPHFASCLIALSITARARVSVLREC
jgi:hypothetical protein